MKNSQTTFEYCSLFYLNQWISDDMGYCSGIMSSDKQERLNTLYAAANFYGVQRTAKLQYDEGIGLQRYEPILNILDEIKIEAFLKDPIDTILEIEKRLSAKYGHDGLLSLTTKFLWLKFKHPIIIYDSQVWNALRPKPDDYQHYYTKWRKEFTRHKPQIKRVCQELSSLSLYTVNPEAATPKYIAGLSSKEWFQERVFDTFLWFEGSKERAQTEQE